MLYSSFNIGTLTFANNATLLSDILSLAERTFRIKTKSRANFALILEPIPRSITRRAAAKGGNSLGLDESKDVISTLRRSNIHSEDTS